MPQVGIVAVVQLSQNHRSSGLNLEQQIFKTILHNLRDGESAFEDWNAVKSRDIYNINNAEDFPRHAIKLSFTNEKVAADNYRRVNDLGVPIASILPNPHQQESTSFTP